MDKTANTHPTEPFDFNSYFDNLDADQFKHLFGVDLADFSFLDHDIIKKSKKELWQSMRPWVKLKLINSVYDFTTDSRFIS